MKLRKISLFCGLLLIAITTTSYGNIRFGSRNSAITIKNSATLDFDQTFTADNGTIRQKDSSSILGSDIVFQEGIFETEESSVFLEGRYRPDVSGTGTILLQGSVSTPQVFRGDSGLFVDFLKVEGNYNRLEGFPLFNNPIQLADANTTLTVALKSVLNKNIELNGGTIILDDDLLLADGVSLTGPGTISLNGRRLSFGTEDLSVTSSLYWRGAADVFLSGKIDLSASWTFDGECYFNADSTILNLLPGGDLTIRYNSSLNIRQLKISGLGGDANEGKIFFEDDTPAQVSTSELHMRRAALDITTTYTVTSGHIIVEVGSGQFITRENTFYVADPARLTIDGVNAYYKTRTFADNDNIRNAESNEADYEDPASNIILLGNADIYHFKTFQSFVQKESSFNDGRLNKNVYLGDAVKSNWRILNTAPNVDGKGWFYHFARSIPNLLIIDTATDAIITSVVLKDFSPHHIFLNAGSSLTFKDDVTIELGNDIPDTNLTSEITTMTFQGECKIDGKGKVVSMDLLKFLVQDIDGGPSTLILQDMVIDKFRDGGIELESDQSKVIFKDVKVIMAEDVTYPKGYFDISGNVEFHSGVTSSEVRFIYDTNATQASTILRGSRLHFDRSVTFSYAPGTSNNDLIALEAKSSELSLHGATLYASNVGFNLTKGALVIDHKCRILNDATSLSEAISFGDGTNINNDLAIEIMPGGNIDYADSIIDYKNVGG